MTPLQRRIGVLLLNEREKRGWSRARMEVESGVSKRQQRRVEHGESLSFRTAERLADSMGIVILVVAKPRQ